MIELRIMPRISFIVSGGTCCPGRERTASLSSVSVILSAHRGDDLVLHDKRPRQARGTTSWETTARTARSMRSRRRQHSGQAHKWLSCLKESGVRAKTGKGGAFTAVREGDPRGEIHQTGDRPEAAVAIHWSEKPSRGAQRRHTTRLPIRRQKLSSAGHSPKSIAKPTRQPKPATGKTRQQN